MFRRLVHLLLLRAFTATAPPTTGFGPLASLLQGQKASVAGLGAGAGSNSYIINPATGNAEVVIGPDISQAPVNTYTPNPGFASTGLSGAGIASHMTGSWVQVA